MRIMCLDKKVAHLSSERDSMMTASRHGLRGRRKLRKKEGRWGSPWKKWRLRRERYLNLVHNLKSRLLPAKLPPRVESCRYLLARRPAVGLMHSSVKLHRHCQHQLSDPKRSLLDKTLVRTLLYYLDQDDIASPAPLLYRRRSAHRHTTRHHQGHRRRTQLRRRPTFRQHFTRRGADDRRAGNRLYKHPTVRPHHTNTRRLASKLTTPPQKHRRPTRSKQLPNHCPRCPRPRRNPLPPILNF
jgi:hypothetical protein